jgi:hypothetical protein
LVPLLLVKRWRHPHWSMDLARHVLSDANSATVRNWRFGRDTASDMIWPHRQNYHAAYDPSRQTLSM